MLAAAIIAGSLILRIADPEPIARLRYSVFDTYQRLAPRQSSPSSPVRIVAIDEASLASEGQWPWPRTRLADLVTRLKSAGARVIAFDILFAEPDRLSPATIAKALGSRPDLNAFAAAASSLPSNDAFFAGVVKGAPVVLGVAGDDTRIGALPPSRIRLSFAGDDPRSYLPRLSGGIENLPELSAAATGLGSVNWLPAEDQVIRRVPTLLAIGGEIYPSLVLESLRVASGEQTVFVKSSGASGIGAFGAHTGIESIRVGTSVISTDARGEFWIRYAPFKSGSIIPAAQILSGSFNPDDIKDRIVLIGATAAGLLDLRATPLARGVPGVEIHAQALEQMLSGEMLERPAYATGLELAFIVGAGALVASLIVAMGPLAGAIAGLSGVALIGALSWLAYRNGGLLFDPVFPSISLGLLYAGLSLPKYVMSELDRSRIRAAFSYYVAPPLVAELAKAPEKLKLGGETREITLLFADVRGFSRFSEQMQAEALIRFVNRLFTPLSDCILDHRGTIDKFMGDAVMAFWNAPVLDAAHARNACRAAFAMQDATSRLNDELQREAGGEGAGRAPLRIGIGINTGPCVVGNVGSPQRFDYSVLGDVVNAASRFEESTKRFGVSIIIGETTAAAVPDFAMLELGRVVLRGKDRPERVYALIGDEKAARSPRFLKLAAAHRALLDAIESNDARQSRAAVDACRAAAPEELEHLYGTFSDQIATMI